MKLQDQCCTVDQGKRLVELGVKAEATFWHMPEKSHLHKEYIRYGWHSDAIAPAYNVGELGLMLPHPSGLNEMGGWVHMSECDLSSGDGKPWYYCWEYDSDKEYGGYKREIIDGATEAQARAAMLIYLLENGFYQVSPDCPDPATVESKPRKVQVTVDLNATRVMLHEQYNDVTTRLNEHMEDDGYIRIHVDELRDPMQALRSSVAILCHTYFEDCEEYASIGKDLPDIVDFNPKRF